MFYSIEEIKKNGISFHQYLNFILVSNNARKAYLIDNVNDKNTYQLLMSMSNKLMSSETDYGVIISKEKYSYMDNDILSEILEFEEKIIDINEPRGVVNINVILNNGEIEELVVFICKRDYDITKVYERVERYKNTLLTNEYTKNYVVDVKAEFKIVYTPTECINAIINNKVDKDIYNEIENIIYNYFGDLIDENEFLKYINFENEFHKGIIISLLLSFKYDRCEQFYPFNEQQDKEYIDVQNKLTNELILLLKKE